MKPSAPLTGLLAVVTQVLVAYAATLAMPQQRGRVVGVVTSGIVVGILLARTVSGAMADLAGWRSIYWLSAALTLLMALLLLYVLPKQEAAQPQQRYWRLIGSVFVLFKEEPVLRQRAVLASLSFASAMVLWTPMVLPLSAPPLSLSHSEIGLFGLAGAAGALAAARAGHLADRGLGHWVSGLSLLLMLASWVPIGLAQSSLWALLLGVITFDLGLQAMHVTSQSLIYGVRHEAQSRLTPGTCCSTRLAVPWVHSPRPPSTPGPAGSACACWVPGSMPWRWSTGCRPEEALPTNAAAPCPISDPCRTACSATRRHAGPSRGTAPRPGAAIP